jgi:hypothetical protein
MNRANQNEDANNPEQKNRQKLHSDGAALPA